jgi:hypothetical protein
VPNAFGMNLQGSQAASCIFRANINIWKGLLKEFSKLVCNFIEVSKNFYFDFSNNKAPKNFLNHQGMYGNTDL